jgi:phage/plasmid-like protein (TIGR03299 family)
MAHQLSIRGNGKAEMAYVGALPWHGLGSELQKGASIDTWKVEAGMDWDILRSPLTYMADDENTYEVAEKNMLYRSDTKAHLSVVSNRYQIVQPGEVLEFFRDLVGASGFELETAGTLFDGKRLWAQASIGESAKILGMDQVDGYLLLSTSCDGVLPTSVRFISERVVCNNTLNVALGEKAKREIVVKHHTSFDHARAKMDLGIAVDQFQKFIAQANQLADTKVDYLAATSFVAKLLARPGQLEADIVERNRTHKKIMELFAGAGKGSDLDSAKGTMWGLTNAVTEFVDHHSYGKSASHQLANAWFGTGDVLKSKALQMAIAGV